jgi:hypothetical protein
MRWINIILSHDHILYEREDIAFALFQHYAFPGYLSVTTVEMKTALIIALLSTALKLTSAAGTTIFDPILIAHAEPSICPSPTGIGRTYTPDPDYLVCCDAGFPGNTRTTAKGPGGKTVYACCASGYICTGAAPVMSDWSIDVNGKAFRASLDFRN